jgi:hypothetical protein
MTLVWAPSFNGVTDPDAQTYLAAVEAADGQAIEGDVALAINDFVVGCKLDGIWDAIKASCILAGARTLSGALVPLAGTAPTNNGPFVSGDYNRKTGLVGDGSTKYLDTNRASNADPQNSLHQTVFLSTAGTTTTNRAHIANSFLGSNTDLTDILALNDNRLIIRSRNSNGYLGINLFAAPAGSTTGFLGTNRAASTNFDLRYAGSTSNLSFTSYTPNTANHSVFARNGSPPSLYSDARLAFYSIGESLDLALLDNRVTTLMTDIGAAIP